MSSAGFALAGALGGVFLAGVMSLVTAMFTHRWQVSDLSRAESHEAYNRKRAERRECSVAFLDASDVYYQATVNYWVHHEDSEAEKDFRRGMSAKQTAYLRLMITNSSPVREAAVEYNKVLNEMEHAVHKRDRSQLDSAIDRGFAVRDALRAAMREELDVFD